MTDVLEKQMSDEEKIANNDISKHITKVLQGPATQKACDDAMGVCGGFPYPPTKQILAVYQKQADSAWAAIKSGYDSFNVSININAPNSGLPTARAKCKFAGSWKGGQSYMLAPGDTISSVAKATYGYAEYADDVWLANSGVLGAQCKQVPAGFGITLPKIWVPDWKTSPKAPICAGAGIKAVKIAMPTIKYDLSKSKSKTQSIVAGPIIIDVTFTISGSVMVQKKGTIDASFNLKSYKAETEKALGPLSAGIGADFKGGETSGSLTFKNPKVKGMTGVKSITLKKGGSLSITLVDKKLTYKHKDCSCEGNVKVEVDIKMRANPKPPPVPVKKPVKVNWPVVIGIVVVTGVVAVGVTVATGGTGAPAAAKGTAVVVGATLAMAGS